MRDLRTIAGVFPHRQFPPTVDQGVFAMNSCIDGGDLRIIATTGEGWDHISVSRRTRCPNWHELEQVKRAFFKDPVPEPVIEAHAHATPAAIRKSITPEAIICFECGLGFKSIKRHLLGHDLTPDAYRSRWGLAANYPLVSSSYSEQRSALAKAIGLGKKR